MSHPEPPESDECRRLEIVDDLDRRELLEDPALDRVAETVAAICGSNRGHVSYMGADKQYVVGEYGMDEMTFERDRSFCARPIAQNDVLIVEDATEDDRFSDCRHVRKEGGIRFYVGIPLVVDSTPIGTLCALDSEPKRIDLDERVELFGAVHAVETHLRVTFHHPRTGPKFRLSQTLTAARASLARARFMGERESDCVRSVKLAEEDLQEGIKLLEVDEPEPASRLGYSDTEAHG